MLNESKVTHTFWGQVTQTIINILNEAHVRLNNDKKPYKLWYGRLALVKHFKFLGSECYIKRNKEKVDNFEPSEDEGILLGYSSRSKR